MIKRALCVWAAPVAALSLALGLAAAAHAEKKPEDPVEKRFQSIEKQLKQLREIVTQARDTGQPVQVRISTDPDPTLDALSTRVDDLEQAAKTRNDQIDTLTHDLELSRKAVADANAHSKGLEDRLEKAEARLKAIDDAQAQAQAAQTAAQAAISGAPAALQAFVETYGDSPYGPEARYWLGDTLYVRGLYQDAAAAYIGSIRGWPTTDWAPNAVVKLARALVALNKPVDACHTLDELKRRYPAAAATTRIQAQNVRAAAKCAA